MYLGELPGRRLIGSPLLWVISDFTDWTSVHHGFNVLWTLPNSYYFLLFYIKEYLRLPKELNIIKKYTISMTSGNHQTSSCRGFFPYHQTSAKYFPWVQLHKMSFEKSIWCWDNPVNTPKFDERKYDRN